MDGGGGWVCLEIKTLKFSHHPREAGVRQPLPGQEGTTAFVGADQGFSVEQGLHYTHS